MEDEQPTSVTVDQVLELLAHGELELTGLMPDSSNYTFLTEVKDKATSALAIYKPRRGERPLWDFQRGTLCRREAAAFAVSTVLGWNIVPPTVLRDAEPHGLGSLQLYIENDPEVHYFALRGGYDEEFKRIAAFDILVNNADRKGGHILLGSDGRIWGIDHGITFHAEPKLRTVIWEYAGQSIPEPLVGDLKGLKERMADGDDSLPGMLSELLDKQEIVAFRRRLDRLIQRPQFPTPGGGRSMPWPPI